MLASPSSSPQRLTWPTSAALPGPRRARYPASSPDPPSGGERHYRVRSPAAFRPPALASWTILFPAWDRPSSRSAHRDKTTRTRAGFPRSTCARPGRGGCRLDPGAAVFTRPAKCLRSPPAASQRPALHPGPASIHPRLILTRRFGGSLAFTRPAFPSPTPSDGSRVASASSLSFAPRRYRRRTSERGRATNTYPGYVIDVTANLHINAPLAHATSCRTIPEMPFRALDRLELSQVPISQPVRAFSRHATLNPPPSTDPIGGSGLRARGRALESPVCDRRFARHAQWEPTTARSRARESDWMPTKIWI